VIDYKSKQNNEKVHSISESARLLLKIIVAKKQHASIEDIMKRVYSFGPRASFY
jgi:hypothetical protein